jgi:hypothetical protein
LNFNESAIRAAVTVGLVERLRDIVPAAIASASTRTAGQYVGQADAIRYVISGDNRVAVVSLNYDPTINPMRSGALSVGGGSAYWVAEYGRAGRAAAPVLRVTADIIKGKLRGGL